MEGLRPPGGLAVFAVTAPIVLATAAMAAAYSGLPAGTCFDVAWTSAAVSALAGMIAAHGRSHPANRMRWTLWALAAAAWLGGQVAWDVFGVIGFPASPNIADIGWWLFALLVTTSMLRLPRGPRNLRVVAAVETIPLIFAAIALILAVLWATASHSQLATGPKISALLYPALYVTATILMLQAMLAGTLRVHTWAHRLVLGGIAAQALGFIMWSSQLLRGTYVPGTSVLDPLWVIGLIAMGVGGLLAARSPEEVARLEEPSQHGAILPAGMFLALAAALVIAQVAGAAEVVAVILRLGILCSGAALIARSSLLGRRLRLMLNRERTALAELAERESQLARLNEQLVEDSRRDPLTGIGNRRALSDDLPMFDALRQTDGGLLAVALCDVDHFKAYNDRLGHLAGDQALRMIAATARGALRATDTAYRFGGEELLLVLRDVDTDEAVLIAERVRAAVERAAFLHPDGEGGLLTVSIGVACGDGEVGELLAQADGALYDAKRLGRNRVLAADLATGPTTLRQRDPTPEAPVPRHLRSMLTVSRAAAVGSAPRVIATLAEVIHSELSFGVVAVNMRELVGEELGENLKAVVVEGDQEARTALLGTSWSLTEWMKLLAKGENIHGASWLRAGTYEWDHRDEAVWTPPLAPSLGVDSWHPEDMLLLPLRSADGEVLGIVSVDQPLLGRRPSEEEIGVLMAVADHAGLALAQLMRDAEAVHGTDELRLAAVMLLAETLDLRDPSTALHARTVGQLARGTARELGLSDERVERIHAAGVLHDLGKLGIADAILQKPGPLDDSEWREMKRHPEVGARILEHAGMRDIAAWVRAHHERVDGQGYPSRRSGPEIPLEARILAVADAYEAMIADRPYRKGIPADAARDELVRCAGTQFDPEVVDAFLRSLELTPADEPALAERAA